MHAQILWNPAEMRWDVVVGRGTARAVVFFHFDFAEACQWATDHGYDVSANIVTT